MSRMTLLAAALLLSTSAFAAESEKDYVVRSSTVQPRTVAEWEAGGKANLAADAEAAKAPTEASRYSEHAYNFETGSIRILDFKRGAAVFHKIGSETALRVMKGSVDIEMDGKKTALKEGDIVQSPKGAIRAAASPEAVSILLWNTTSRVKTPKTQVIKAEQTKPVTTMDYEADGKIVHAAKPEELAKAPKDAMTTTVKRYELDGNSVRVVHSENKGVSGTTSGKIDGLAYVTQGRATLVENGKEYIVSAGDAFRQAGGATHNWKRTGTFEFVSTSSVPKDGKEREIPAGVREDAR